jgi:hypothetical protein
MGLLNLNRDVQLFCRVDVSKLRVYLQVSQQIDWVLRVFCNFFFLKIFMNDLVFADVALHCGANMDANMLNETHVAYNKLLILNVK